MAGLLPFAYASRNLGRSSVRLLLSVGGSALVVLLVMGGAGFALGMEASLRASGTPGNVIMLGAGSEESLERSEVSPATAGVLGASLRGIRSVGGQLAVSSEIHAPLPMTASLAATSGADAQSDEGSHGKGRDLAMVRGFTPAAFLVHPQVQMIAGRIPEQGADEIMLGVSAARRAGLNADAIRTALKDDGTGGPTVVLDGRPIRIVGLFQATGTVMDGEVWAPLTDLLMLTQRDTISAVVLNLDSETDPADVSAFAQRRIDLELSAISETDYYAGLSAFYLPVRVMVLASAALVAAGALLGGLNTMYAAFVSRVREIGMLQCLGYSRLAVVVSLLQESILASTAGALVAIGLSIWLLNGVRIEFSMGTFGIVIDERVVLLGLCSGVLVGAAGCIIPALRCLRLPLPVALKSD